MALRKRASTAGLRSRYRRSGKRSSKKSYITRDLKRAGYGTLAGLAVSVPLTLAGRHFNQPLLIEAGQRIGSVASTVAGGTPGNAAYQAADAVFDRVVMYQGAGVSGSQGQVYL